MTYTLAADPYYVIRDEDQAFIPFDPDNTDYRDYLWWLDEGNEPTPYTLTQPLPDNNLELTVLKSGGGAFPMDGPVPKTR
jgi:hypothetical protein